MQQPTLLTAPMKHPLGTGYLPQWLAAELQEKHPNRMARTATWTRCGKCKEIILTGLDADLLATAVHADPTPLTDHQELAALLTGRRTFNIDHDGPGARIHYRTRWEMLTPPSRNSQPTIPEHACGRRFPSFLVPPEPTPVDSEHPPF